MGTFHDEVEKIIAEVETKIKGLWDDLTGGTVVQDVEADVKKVITSVEGEFADVVANVEAEVTDLVGSSTVASVEAEVKKIEADIAADVAELETAIKNAVDPTPAATTTTGTASS